MFLFLFNGKKYEDAVKDRLIVPVKICLEGQECGTAAQANQTAAAAPVAVTKVELSEGSEHTIKMLNSGEGGQMIFEPAVIKVSKGDKVDIGTELVVIEAMKMENSLVAEKEAEVKDVKVKAGDNVQSEQVLIEFV